jgi:hypothetical protein
LRNNRFAVPPAQGYTGRGIKDALILPSLNP